ncbi:MAG: L,D-transpeptidase family protein [Gammaproteobacteria bacterium]
MLRIRILLCCIGFSMAVQANDSIWLLVDTTALKIEVKRGDKTLDTIDDIAIGRGGAGFKSRRGDDVTPFGEYRIGWVGERSSFRKFFGLTYPSPEDAEIAFKKGLIDQATFDRIIRAHRYHQVPPQNTPLGGQIGIHGLGRADMKIHKSMNWTHGCIAMTNSQIDHLSHWLETGTLVKIK